jgi:very-short-patch-repair endonuclease
MTEAEQVLWRRLRQRQVYGHKFRRQFPLGVYVVDFACLERRLIVEVDGGQHGEQQSYDQRRDQWLQAQGFRVLRFWNHQVLQETDAVVAAIAEALKRSQPYSSPVC